MAMGYCVMNKHKTAFDKNGLIHYIFTKNICQYSVLIYGLKKLQFLDCSKRTAQIVETWSKNIFVKSTADLAFMSFSS